MMLATANVKLQGRGHMLVSHDALNHVGWYLVVNEPSGVCVPEIMKPQRLPGMAGHMFDCLCIRADGRCGSVAGISSPDGPVAIVISVTASSSVTVPSIPALTRVGRHTLDRNRVRRNGMPTWLGKINPAQPG